MIFYAIYKKQPKHFYYLSYQLQGGPRKDFPFCSVVPGGGRPARLEQIPVRLAGVWPGKCVRRG
jgi:hypothetical protein